MIPILITSLIIVIIILLWAITGNDTKPDANKTTPPEKIYRRRASDLEIEEQYPDATKPKRRATDVPVEKTFIDEDFKLPYSAEEIIPPYSRFRIYMRILMNAEVYAKKGDFTTAISLYEGVNERILDAETNTKIEANIDYLKKYKQKQEQQHRQREAEAKNKPNEIKISLDSPIKLPDKIQIGFNPQPLDVDRIVDEITKRIQEKQKLKNLEETTIDKYKDEIATLASRLEDLKKELGSQLKGLASKDESSEIQKLQSQLNDLTDRMFKLYEEKEKTRQELENLKEVHSRLLESGKQPQVSTVKYEGKLPIELDPEPILKILEKLPTITAPHPQPVNKDKIHSDMAKDILKKLYGDTVIPAPTTQSSQVAEKTEKQKEEEDWELIRDIVKDDKKSQLDEVSDEDIFKKILEDDKHKKNDEIEILGDYRKSEDVEYDTDDPETLRKLEEDRKFYEKFLQHDRRKKKELPILKVTYDFKKLPDEFSLSREKNILEYAFYKYRPLLQKADDLIKKRKVRDALNYYKVVMQQNIPPEFKSMIRKNINDLNEYLEKYLTSD
ncbi:MAG: hypothetical protein N3F66_06835 [Spirochaetes bacterium]|nr:hypothetical protein [Spirochaetota bacterium]